VVHKVRSISHDTISRPSRARRRSHGLTAGYTDDVEVWMSLKGDVARLGVSKGTCLFCASRRVGLWELQWHVILVRAASA
jgi:hypothetical protein